MDKKDARAVIEERIRDSDNFHTDVDVHREMRPLQARDQQNSQKRVDSKRKLMEELLALKQEVNFLRRAAERNEDNGAGQSK